MSAQNECIYSVCMCVCVAAVSHHNPQVGLAVYAGVFGSCSYDAAVIEPVSPGSSVRLVGRWPRPHLQVSSLGCSRPPHSSADALMGWNTLTLAWVRAECAHVRDQFQVFILI